MHSQDNGSSSIYRLGEDLAVGDTLKFRVLGVERLITKLEAHPDPNRLFVNQKGAQIAHSGDWTMTIENHLHYEVIA